MIVDAREVLSRIDGEKSLAEINEKKEDLLRRKDILFNLLESGKIHQPDFDLRYQQINNKLNSLESDRMRSMVRLGSRESLLENMTASFEQVASFEKTFDHLDDDARVARLRLVLNNVKATKESACLSLYTDLSRVSSIESNRAEHDGQTFEETEGDVTQGFYNINYTIPKQIFIKDYPHHPKTFGQQIRKARKDRGMTATELANLIGVSEDSVLNWEARGKNPSLDNRLKLQSFIDSSSESE